MMRPRPLALSWFAPTAAVAFCVLALPAAAQEIKPDDRYVTREEYEKVLKRLDAVTGELEAVKSQQLKSQQGAAINVNPTTKDADAAVEEVRQTVREIQDQLRALGPGTHSFLVTGFGFAGFEDHRGSASTFTAGVNPILLWKIGERLFFETEFEVELASDEGASSTEFNLETVNLNYLVSDHLLIGGGRFKTPLGIFNDRLESKWINKLPDRPLPYDDERGIAQEATLGVYAKGAFGTPIGGVNYAIYAGNGPTLQTQGDNVGTLDFDNFGDENDNKAVGGRVGWIPLQYLELGYSVQFAKVNPPGFEDVHAFTQALDLSYVRTLGAIKGQIDARAEWVFQNVDDATFVVDGAATRFNNDRNAGYVQLAYRPTQAGNKFLRNLEFVGRYDRLNVSQSAPDGGFEQRYALGVDYWLNASTVIKIAYEIDDRQRGENADAFFVQGVMGF
jgi:hypothetical protein